MLLIEDALALFRLTRLSTEDEITRPLRERAQRWAQDGGHAKLNYMLTCPHCQAIWWAPVVMLMPRKARRAFALAGAVSLLADMREHYA
jgi:hypothetical protein